MECLLVAEGLETDTQRLKRQGRRLRDLRDRMGVSKTRIMDEVGLDTTNGYDLYERGRSIIRMDRVEDWARAFGMPPLVFVAALLYDDEERELRLRIAHATDPSEYRLIDSAAKQLMKQPPEVREEALSILLEAWAKRDTSQ